MGEVFGGGLDAIDSRMLWFYFIVYNMVKWKLVIWITRKRIVYDSENAIRWIFWFSLRVCVRERNRFSIKR